MSVGAWVRPITWTNCALAIAVAILLSLILLKRKNSNRLPPGPFCLPIIGNLHQIGKNFHTSLFEMSKKYGNVFRLYLGGNLVIVVSGRRLFTDLLVTRSALFSKRPVMPIGSENSRSKSFVFSTMSIEEHRKQKSIAMTALKSAEKSFSLPSSPNNSLNRKNSVGNSGDVRTCLENIFAKEAVSLGRQMVRLGDEYESKYAHIKNGLEIYKENVWKVTLMSSIRSMCFFILGKKYQTGDEQIEFIADIILEMQDCQKKMNILSAFPFLKTVWKRPLNVFSGVMKSYNGILEMHINACKVAKTKEESNDSSTESSSLNSVVDTLLQMKSKKEYQENDDEVTLSLVGGIFGAGVDTFSVLSRWIFIYLAVYSEHARKAQDEVDKFVDRNRRMPGYADRYDLPFVMAFLTEVIRHSSFIPFTVPHAPAEDTHIDGYQISRDATIFVSFMSLNWDPEVFEDYQVFSPNRFIKDDRSFDKILAEKVNVHGAGRRICAGMAVSKIQAFVSIATFLHTFDFKCLKNHEPKIPDSTMVISILPEIFPVRVCEREDVS